jgi:predicted transcriptional regulator
MHTHELLFELSHPIRFDIMRILAESPLRLTKIGEQVDANNPEVSRHLDRLKLAGLVGKGSDGRYHTTNVGDTLFSLLPSISFIAHNTDLIERHDFSCIPPSFLSRIGELSTGKQAKSVLNAVHHGLKIILDAEERVFVTTNETNDDYQQAISDKFASGIPITGIIGTDFRFTSKEQIPPEEMAHSTMRVFEDLPVMILANEREAGVCFRNERGIFEVLPLYSTDPVFLAWCEDLFDHLWKTSEPLYDHLEVLSSDTS